MEENKDINQETVPQDTSGETMNRLPRKKYSRRMRLSRHSKHVLLRSMTNTSALPLNLTTTAEEPRGKDWI